MQSRYYKDAAPTELNIMQSRYYKDIAPTELSIHRVVGWLCFLFFFKKFVFAFFCVFRSLLFAVFLRLQFPADSFSYSF